MSKTLLGALAVAAVVAMAGCQNMQYKALTQLPSPVFGEDASPAPAPQIAQVPANKPPVQPPVAPPTTTGGMQLNPAWEQHGPDRAWRYIVIHHSASPAGNAAIFDREHRVGRGWDELGYHFVIDNGRPSADGLIEIGSRWIKQKHGAHCKTNDERFNQYGIGICLVGNFEEARPTAAQWAAAVRLAGYMAHRYDIPVQNILGHGEAVAQTHERGTKCPGKFLDMDAFRAAVRNNTRVAMKNGTNGG